MMGNSVVLECKVEGPLKPTVSWFKVTRSLNIVYTHSCFFFYVFLGQVHGFRLNSYCEISRGTASRTRLRVRSAKTDKPTHPRSLIRVFAVRVKTHWIPFEDSDADAQADLSLLGAHVIM